MSHHPSPPTPTPSEIPFLRQKALDSILSLDRDQAADLACSLCDKRRCAWVREMAREGTLEIRCMGRFDLHNEIMEQLPWPAVMFLVVGKRLGKVLTCALALHILPEQPGEWGVTDGSPVVMGVQRGVMTINGRPFCGDRAGAPGVINGDAPTPARREPAPSAAAQSPTPFDPDPEPDQPPPRIEDSPSVQQTPLNRDGVCLPLDQPCEGGIHRPRVAPVADTPHSNPKLEFAMLLLKFLQDL